MENEVKKEFWSLDTLRSFAQETKEVEVLGKLLRIKKLPASVMLMDNSKDLFAIMSRGVVEPKITKEIFENIPIDFATAVVKEIMDYSNLNMDKAEKN